MINDGTVYVLESFVCLYPSGDSKRVVNLSIMKWCNRRVVYWSRGKFSVVEEVWLKFFTILQIWVIAIACKGLSPILRRDLQVAMCVCE